MMIAAPISVYWSGRVCHSSQSIATPQARAEYSKGATTEASPWLKASVIASWPKKPEMARPSSSHTCFGSSATQFGAASVVAPIAISSISQNIIWRVLLVRACTRAAIAETA